VRVVLAILLLATVLIWMAFLIREDRQCDGVLVARAWPPGVVCVAEVP
jgi:hypothetical protein